MLIMKEWNYMQVKLDDTGGARELAFYRISVANEDLKAAERNSVILIRILCIKGYFQKK